MGWLGVWSHMSLQEWPAAFFEAKNSLRNDLTFIISRWSCRWAFLCCCCRSCWLCLKRRSARKPMVLGKRKLPNLQSYIPSESKPLVPGQVLFYTESLLFVFQKMIENQKLAQCRNHWTISGTNQPFNRPTSQSSNLPTLQLDPGTDSPLQSAVHFEPRVIFNHGPERREDIH